MPFSLFEERLRAAAQARAAATAGTRQARSANVPPASAPTRIPGTTGPERAPAPAPTLAQGQGAGQPAPATPPAGLSEVPAPFLHALPRAEAPAPNARWLAARGPAAVEAALRGFSDREVAALPFLFDFWAMPHQLPPRGDWKTWVVMGGRGAGKTRAGAEWVRSQVEGPRPRDKGRCRRLALLAETLDQAREVMVFGDSGILACSPPDRRPVWHATRRLLEWPNGATAQVFSASDPESLRGPQFDGAWADELAKWRKGQEAWDMLQFGLRLGDDPRCVVTTTPRTVPLLQEIMAREGTITTHGSTTANRANLARSFLQEVTTRYAGTRLGRQELDGELLLDIDGALWSRERLDALRADPPDRLDRVVVAVDPAVSANKGSDSTGIVACGARLGPDRDAWRAWVLEDATVQGGRPDAWARAAVACARRHAASRVIAEANQGGEMVAQVLRSIDPHLPVTLVHAREGKALRAEPVSALYEQGKVHHARGRDLRALEDQMLQMTTAGWRGRGSPDRLDACVWALHALLVDPAAGAIPAIRRL